MSTLFDLFFLSSILWLAVWRRLGDRNGWLALINAWAWWLLSAALPAGVIALWRRSRLASLVWGIGVAALWLREYGWTLPSKTEEHGLTRMGGIDTGRKSSTFGKSRTSGVTLLTCNLLNNPRDLTPVLQWTAREMPDVLLFQECIPSHAAPLERGLAPAYPHRLWLPAVEYGMGFGVASRQPFALTGFWQYPGFEPFAARITLLSDLTGGPVAIDCQASDWAGPPVRSGRALDIYCVQFISPTNEVRRVGPTALLRLREAQIDWVLREIARRKQPALVAGDWNTTEGNDIYRRAAAQLVDGWREAGDGPGWSWPRRLNPYVDKAALPVLRLDCVMHTGSRFAPGLSVAEMRVIRDDLGSDHCPLLVRVEGEE